MRKPVILIIDDEQMMLRMLGGLLHQEYRVLVATNGEQALMRAQGPDRPDLVLLDVVMPGMDGYEVCRQLKASELTAEIPVIFLTVNSDEKEEAEGFRVGAVDYINKPIRPSVLLARVHTHLRLKQMNEELKQKNEELEHAAQLRDDVDRITHHDLKNPLSSIISVPAMLMPHYPFSDKHKLWLRNVEQAGRKMLDMINRSLDLYKMESGAYEPQPQPFDILPVIRAAAHESALGHTDAGKSWQLHHQGEMAADDLRIGVMGEELLCYPMFSNLLQNAFEASPDEECVEISVEEHAERDRVTISITNRGSVPVEIRDRFFDKYVTSGKKHGTGLGTYSARLCAETQNGSIRLEPLEDKTCVVVELPRHIESTMKRLKAILRSEARPEERNSDQ